MKKNSLVVSAVLFSLGASEALAAEEARILGHKINGLGDQPEVCVSLDKPVAVSREDVLAALKLEQEDKPIAVPLRNISVSTGLFCIQNLQYERSYTLSLVPSRNASAPFRKSSLSFSIPSRTASLSFVLPACGKKCALFAKTPTLEAVNIQNAHFVVYKIVNPLGLAKAWRQIKQTSVVPSESLTLAKENGQEIWQTDLAFGLMPHQTQQIEAPLPSLDNGLYFVSVTPQSGPSGIAADPKQVAGTWLARSTFSVSTLAAPDGVYAFAANEKGPLANVQLTLVDANNEIIAKETTQEDGNIHFTLSGDVRLNDVTVVATHPDGSIALADISAFTRNTATTASIALDRDSYTPSSIVMAAMDTLPRPLGGSVRLMTPKGEVVVDQTLVGSAPFLTALTLPLDATEGDWSLEWRQADNKPLAKKTLHVVPVEAPNKIHLTVDRKQIDADGALTLDIQIQGAKNAYQSGQVLASFARPSFAAWPDYFFGVDPTTPDEKKIGSFLTNAQGYVRVPLSSIDSNGGALRLSVSAQDATRQKLVMPFKPTGSWVGLKRLPPSRMDEAAFSFIALDANLKRTSLSDLFLNVYQDARSFEWRQEDGQWGYRPLPQLHRVTSLPLSVLASSETVVRLPLPAGFYVSEITTDAGQVLTRHSFQMKTGEEKDSSDEISLDPKKKGVARLTLEKPATVAVVVADDKTHQVVHRFYPAGNHSLDLSLTATSLDQMVLASVTYAQDSQRSFASNYKLDIPVSHAKTGLSIDLPEDKMISAAKKTNLPVLATGLGTSASGRGALAFENGQVVRLNDMTFDKTGKGSLLADLTAVHGPSRLAALAWNNDQSEVSFTDATVEQPLVFGSVAPSVMSAGNRVDMLLRVLNKAAPEGVYTYAITSYEGAKFLGKTTGEMTLKKKQSVRLPLSFVAVEAGVGVARVEITGPDHFRYNEEISFEILSSGREPAYTANVQKIDAKQNYKNDGFAGFSFAAPTELVSATRLFEAALLHKGYTVAEQTTWLELSKSMRDLILATAWETPTTLARKQYSVMKQLFRAQKDSGGFTACQGCEGEDITSTARAIWALYAFGDQADALMARQRAVAWLKRKLENAWFDEKEQRERAEGLLVLARISSADLSALRYFADTIRDKKVEPLVDAKLSLAFHLAGDADASKEWFARAMQNDGLAQASAEMVSVLADNPLADPQAVAKRGLELMDTDPSFTLLRAALSLSQRTGSWYYSDTSGKKRAYGIALLSKDLNSKEFANNHSAPLYIADLTRVSVTGTPPFAEQHLYQLDGGLLDDNNPLEKNGVYLLEISAPKPEKEGTFIVRLALGAGFEPLLSSYFTSEAMAAAFPSLGKDLTPLSHVDVDNGVVTFVMKSSGEEKGSWRLALPIRTQKSGKFRFPLLEELDDQGAPIAVGDGRLSLTVK